MPLPPSNTTVGVTRYPDPGLITVMDTILPNELSTAVASAPEPVSPSAGTINMVGAIVYPVP